MSQEIEERATGYQIIEKTVRASGNFGSEVKVILIEKLDDEKQHKESICQHKESICRM